MSNIITAPFEVQNFQKFSSFGTTTSAMSLTGFTLPNTPFTFYPNFDEGFIPGVDVIFVDSNDNPFEGENFPVIGNFLLEKGVPPSSLRMSTKKIVWYFGDDTYSTELTAKHIYKNPGVYNVSCVYFDASGSTFQNTFSQSLTVYNYLPDTLTPFVTSGYINETTGRYTLTAGRIEHPFKITRTSSWQTASAQNNEFYYRLFSLSGSKNFFDQGLANNKYAQLYPYSSFYEVGENGEFVELNLTTTDSTSVFCVLSGIDVLPAESTTVGSVFCGSSGQKILFYKDDLPCNSVNLYIAQFDSANTANNYIPIGINCEIVANPNISAFAITSNGITGEGGRNDTFEINSIKYVNEKINFIVTIKDKDWYTIAKTSNLILGNVSLTNRISVFPINSNGVPDHTLGVISTNFSYLSSVSGGFYRGTFKPTVTASNIALSAYGLSIAGKSSSFTVYPSSGAYFVSKINEDFDAKEQYKKLRFQEFMQNYNVLFDDFIGTIVGDISSNPTDIGKLMYEKIANFVDNKSNIDKCDVDSLFSLSNEINYNFKKFERSNFNFPAEIKRLVDLCSINHSRLWGAQNKFNLNFDPRLGADSEKYGLNLGSLLDFNTTVLSLSTGFIVARENFSNRYKLCNTYINTLSTSLLSPSLSTYALSSYNDTWGWGLVLDNTTPKSDIPKYYTFFSYVSSVSGDYLDNTINFNDVINTLSFNMSSYQEWSRDGGIVDNLISNVLYTNVNLLTS